MSGRNLPRLFALSALLQLALVAQAIAHEGLHAQIAAVTAQIRSEPGNASLYLKRGELYRLHREWNLALTDYNKAEKLNSGLAEVNFGRGRTYFEAGKPQQARVWLDRLLAVRQDHVEGLVTRARVLLRLRKYNAAATDYSNVLAQVGKPKPEYYLERAEALVAGGRSNEALNGVDEGIRKLGPIVTLQLFAIDLELARKNYDAALTRVEQIATQSVRKESWLARRGEILLQAGRTDEAREAFKSAIVAIEGLPAIHRAKKATVELERRVRRALGSK
jgi:tetratricopeptide (TPR) repeat protein